MSEGWAGQLAPMGIGMSVLCPGYVRTLIHESWRNKQAEYGGAAPSNSGVAATADGAAAAVLGGIDPDVVGARVVEAIKAGELYIFTHREMRAFVEARFQPAYVTPQAGSGAALSSTRQKSEVLELARKVAPVWKSARLPPPCCPQTGLWKFQYTTSEGALPTLMPQWLAVMK